MAERGFTVKDMLKDTGVKLNSPPFMEGHAQLPIEEVQEGRRIASVCIHAERAIGWMKNLAILHGDISHQYVVLYHLSTMESS